MISTGDDRHRVFRRSLAVDERRRRDGTKASLLRGLTLAGTARYSVVAQVQGGGSACRPPAGGVNSPRPLAVLPHLADGGLARNSTRSQPAARIFTPLGAISMIKVARRAPRRARRADARPARRADAAIPSLPPPKARRLYSTPSAKKECFCWGGSPAGEWLF